MRYLLILFFAVSLQAQNAVQVPLSDRTKQELALKANAAMRKLFLEHRCKHGVLYDIDLNNKTLNMIVTQFCAPKPKEKPNERKSPSTHL